MINSDSLQNNLINEGEIKIPVENNNKFLDEIKFLFEYIITHNNNNKVLKISLYKIRGFNPNIIFDEIDNISTGFLNIKDFKDYLEKNKIKIDNNIILLFIREYNKQEKDSNLYFQDFINFLKFDINKSEINIGELNFDKDEINKIFLKLLESEFKLIKEKNDLVDKITKIKEFSTYEAFYVISNDQQYINYESLNLFLSNKYSKNEIKELIYRLDMNNDGKISYEEFQDLFFPFQEHLNLEETSGEDIYKDSDEDKKYDIKIKYEFDNNINLYKDNTLTDPKIIYIYNNNDDDKDTDNVYNNDKKEELNSESLLNDNLNNLNSYNASNGYIDDKYLNEELKINYDENILKEINEEENEIHSKNELEKDNKNDYNSKQIKEKKSYNSNINNVILETYENNSDNNEDEKLNRNKENKNSNNELNQDCQDYINSKSDIFLSNLGNKKLDNNNSNTIKNIDELNNFINPENIKKINNYTDIFSEKDKITINIFIDYIHSLILLENKLENIRESISLCEDISLLNIFSKFDINKNNLISKEAFIYVCNMEYFIFPTDNQIDLLFKRFDLDNDGQLNFEEFMNIISPLRKEYLTLYDKEENTNNNISFNSKKKIIELLKLIINTETSIYELKTKLTSNKNFNFIDFWGLLMKYSQDNVKVNKNEFNSFLENFGCFLTNYESEIIFWKFAKGKNEIKYNDLYTEIIN